MSREVDTKWASQNFSYSTLLHLDLPRLYNIILLAYISPSVLSKRVMREKKAGLIEERKRRTE